MNVNDLKKEIVQNTTDALIKDLKELDMPEDFKDAHAYNLIQYAFSLMVTGGMAPDEINKKLHQLVDKATDNFFNEVVNP